LLHFASAFCAKAVRLSPVALIAVVPALWWVFMTNGAMIAIATASTRTRAATARIVARPVRHVRCPPSAESLGSRLGWSSALRQTRHECVGLCLRGSSELSGQSIKVARSERALGVAEDDREFIAMGLEILSKSSMKDLLR
jgi:hypothetical protein